MDFSRKVFSTFFLLSVGSFLRGQDLNSGLIGHWKFDESSGTTANDGSGNSYHAELFNAGDGSSSWVDGKVNGGIELDGTDDYLAIQSLNYTQSGEIPAMTAVAWVKTSKADQSYVISYDRSENWRFTVSGDLNNGRMFLASTDSTRTLSDDYGNTVLNDGNWHLITVSYDSSTSLKKFYLDGNPDGTITAHSNNPLGAGDTTRFGVIGTGNEEVAYNTFQTGNGDGRNYVHNFDGTLDEIRLYDRALTDAEVNYLYFRATNDSDSDGLSNAEEDSLGTSSSNTDTDGDGISDWDEINGYHTFTQVDGAMTWTAAKSDAESRGGYLATITSAEENARVLDSLSESTAWIGGSDASSEGTWTWVTGESWNYSNWATSEPNGNSVENYTQLYRSNGNWNDQDSTDVAYILEKEFSPTNPLQSDSDGDGVDDLSEINQGRDPNFVELTDWTAVGNGVWNLQSNDLSVQQTENSTVIYFLSPYDVQNRKITYQMKVSGSTDNDWIGFVVGYQDSSNYSYFTLTRSEQTGAGNPLDGWNFIEVSNGVSTTLSSDESNYTKGWELDADYNVTVSYTSGETSIHLQGGSLAFANGSSLVELNRQNPSGKFGFYGSSQDGITFSNLKFETLYSPTITLLGNASETVEGATSFSDSGAIASDTEDGNLTASIQVSGAVDLNTVGSYALVYSVTDSSGIEANVSRSVTVVDTTNPIISLAGNSSITHEATTAYTDAGASWTDTLDGSGTLTASGTVDVNTVGAYSLTYDYTDAAGNAGTQVIRTVNVVDTTNPIITLTGNSSVTHEAATAYTDAGASWTDTLDGSGNVTATGTVDVNAVGSYPLTYDYTDAEGNEGTQVTRTVNVVDTTSPIITLTGNSSVTHEAATAYTDAGAGWTDTLDGSGTLTANGTVDVNTVGAYTLTYDYTDAAGNEGVQVIRTVNVVDTTNPIITLMGDATITHEAATAYTDLGAGWTDTLDGSGTLTATGTVDVNTVGAYTLTYDFTDAAGNAGVQVTRTVNVVDTTKPVISLLGDRNVTHSVWTAYSDAGAEASDTLDGNLTAKLVLTNGMDVNLPGSYLLTYHVQDAAGNDAVSVTREVQVVNQAPTQIYLSNLSIEENLPAGTEVGTFSTSDPDDPDHNRSYQYTLVGGEGIASFELSSRGALQSAEVFDYESKLSYALTIRSVDEFGGSLDQNFTIEILDAFHAIVDTGAIVEVGDSFVSLSGEVLDSGGLAGVGQRGFLVSTIPEPIYGDWESIQTQAGSGVGPFNAQVNGLKPGTQYYATAYVVGYEGISYGASEKFSTTKPGQPLFITDAQKVEGSQGWWSSTWLGEFYEVDHNGWLLHAQIGWLFAVPDATDGIWFWTDKLGWIWSKAGVFPYFHANDSQGWIFFHGNDANHSLFYDYQNQDWIMIQK